MDLEELLGDASELPSDVREWLERKKHRDEILASATLDEDTIKLLEQYGKTPADLKPVFFDLMAAGGEPFALKVVSSVELLAKYLEMRSKNVPSEEIVANLGDTAAAD